MVDNTPCRADSITEQLYTGMLYDDWVKASKEGISPQFLPDVVRSRVETEYGTLVGVDAFIDGWIEGYLTGVHGEAYYARVKVNLPGNILLMPETHEDFGDGGRWIGWVVSAEIPVEALSLDEAWQAGPELAEDIREAKENR